MVRLIFKASDAKKHKNEQLAMLTMFTIFLAFGRVPDLFWQERRNHHYLLITRVG
jgi:hypothetical protein